MDAARLPTIIHQVGFTQSLLPLVSDFDCSVSDPPEHWEEEINQWIRMERSSKDGALYCVAERSNQVWLYHTPDNEIIGYGSLCPSHWPDPVVVEKVKKAKRVPITLIPAVGINRRFHGGPYGSPPMERYSTKILNHLVAEAAKHTSRQPFLGLYVHPGNERAIKCYRRYGFVDFSQRYRDEAHGVEYISMILKIG